MNWTVVWIAVMVLGATAGETMLSAGMRQICGLDGTKHELGALRTFASSARSPLVVLGVCSMAVSFFALLAALPASALSLVASTTNALTFVATAFTERFLLRERVAGKRWLAVLCICAGIAAMAYQARAPAKYGVWRENGRIMS